MFQNVSLFFVCLQENMKKAEQFGFVSSVMELDHFHSLKRYKYVKGSLISLNGFLLLHLFFLIFILYSCASLSLSKLQLNLNLLTDSQYVLPNFLLNE